METKYVLTETEKNAPEYKYQEEYPTQAQAHERMMQMYHDYAIAGLSDAIHHAEYAENSAIVQFEDGNEVEWDIEEVTC